MRKKMTEEQIKQLCKESYEQGQIDGIKLACDSLALAIQSYKKSIEEIYCKDKSK